MSWRDYLPQLHAIAADLGLNVRDINWWEVPADRLYAIAAAGLPGHYPHWSIGRDFERERSSHQRGRSQISEMVCNLDPAQAYLLDENNDASHVFVAAHVLGHVDLFGRNVYSLQQRLDMDQVLHAATLRFREYEAEYGIDTVESVIDAAHALKWHATRSRPDPPKPPGPEPADRYRDLFPGAGVDPSAGMRAYKADFRSWERGEGERDLLRFLCERAPLEPWERDVLSVVREMGLYQLPQTRVKVLHEGWACATGDTLVPTGRGLLPMAAIFREGGGTSVWGHEGGHISAVHLAGWQKTVKVITALGFELEGALEHRVRTPEGGWVELKDLKLGDPLALAGPCEVWPEQECPWAAAPGGEERTEPLQGLAQAAQGQSRLAIAPCNEETGRFGPDLGFLAGTWLARRGEPFSFGRLADARRFVSCAEAALDARGEIEEVADERGVPGVLVHLRGKAQERFFSQIDQAARQAGAPAVPQVVMRSPRPVVAAFVAGFWAAAGAAEQGGGRLVTGNELGRTLQVLLLHLGVVAQRRRKGDGRWELGIFGDAWRAFCAAVVEGREDGAVVPGGRGPAADHVASLGEGLALLYDMSVDGTHNYASGGLISHNSYCHKRILRRLGHEQASVIADARMNARVVGSPSAGGFNPYWLGLTILEHLERQGADLLELVAWESDFSLIGRIDKELMGADETLRSFWAEAGDWRKVRDGLMRLALRLPEVEVRVKHAHGVPLVLAADVDVDRSYGQPVIDAMARLWGGKVILEQPGGQMESQDEGAPA